MADLSLPVFDLTELRRGVPERQTEFLSCLRDMGAFYLTGHGVPEDSHRAAVDAAMDFFLHSTDEEKDRVTNRNKSIRRGYSRLEAESTAQVTNTGEYSDYSMAYSMGLSENLFASARLESAFTAYFDRLYAVAKESALAVLEASRAECEGGHASFVECDPLFRLRYFPDVPQDRCAETQPLRMAPHYDLSIVTLIQQTACENGFVSLHSTVDGELVPVPPKPGAMVVFCGAVATIVSEGRVMAPRHQVASPTEKYRVGSSRTSSVFFLRPRSDFRFSVPCAKAYGLNVSVSGPTATFRDWIGGNYETMNTPAFEA